VATTQSDPAEALDLEGLHARRGEQERAVAGADDVEPAPLEQLKVDSHRAGAVAAQQRQIGEVGARGDGVSHSAIPQRRTDNLQHAEPLHPAPRGRGNERHSPEPELLQARSQADAVEVPTFRDLVGGGVHPQLEHPERGAPRGEPGREARHGEGAVDDQLPEARDGGHHPADDVVRGAPGRVEGVPLEEERG